jgi:hypothetical protein
MRLATDALKARYRSASVTIITDEARYRCTKAKFLNKCVTDEARHRCTYTFYQVMHGAGRYTLPSARRRARPSSGLKPRPPRPSASTAPAPASGKASCRKILTPALTVGAARPGGLAHQRFGLNRATEQGQWHLEVTR